MCIESIIFILPFLIIFAIYLIRSYRFHWVNPKANIDSPTNPINQGPYRTSNFVPSFVKVIKEKLPMKVPNIVYIATIAGCPLAAGYFTHQMATGIWASCIVFGVLIFGSWLHKMGAFE